MQLKWNLSYTQMKCTSFLLIGAKRKRTNAGSESEL